MSHADVDPNDPDVFDPFDPSPITATRQRPPTIRFRCELCGDQLVARGARDVGPVERNHLVTCPAVAVAAPPRSQEVGDAP